jgi:putative hydrolase of the HAD superfamily
MNTGFAASGTSADHSAFGLFGVHRSRPAGVTARTDPTDWCVNVVFDLGGVVVRWEPDAIIARSFTDPATREAVRAGIVAHPDWLALDRGAITPEQLIVRGAQRTGLGEAQVAAFVRSVPPQLSAIPETVELLHRVHRRGHPLYCLSNMPEYSMRHLEQANDFWHLFTGKVVSSRVGYCKPEREIYEHPVKVHALVPAETVFIDDVERNVAAAREFGLHGIRFTSAQQCEADLASLGV